MENFLAKSTWQQTPLHQKKTIPWSTSYRTSRREEVILSPLRIGHIRLTHLYIISPNLLSPPSRPYCQYENLSVEHFFSCPLLQPLRLSLQVPPTPTQALKNNSDSISLTYLPISTPHPILPSPLIPIFYAELMTLEVLRLVK